MRVGMMVMVVVPVFVRITMLMVAMVVPMIMAVIMMMIIVIVTMLMRVQRRPWQAVFPAEVLVTA